MIKNKKLLFVLLFFLFTYNVYAQINAVAKVQSISGNVEIKKPGSAVWEKAEVGQIIDPKTTVSTGFKSEVIIKTETTEIKVRPLTRLSLDELEANEDSEIFNISLQTGRLRIEVNPPAGLRASARFTSPSSVASVRGTVFEFSTINLIVIEGSVEFSGSSGAAVIVDAGRHSFTDDHNNRPASVEDTSALDLKPDLPVTSGLLGSSEEIIDIIRSAPAADPKAEVNTRFSF